MGEVPVADAVVRGFEAQVERPVVVLAGHEGERLVQRVPEPGVDVPDPGRVVVRREVGNREHQVVRELLDVRPGGTVHAADMPGDGVARGPAAAR